MVRSQVFGALSSRGASKAVVHFSGGNDEGYCDGVNLLDEDGNTIATLDEHDDDLARSICAPVYDRYGSFAGEFYVDGTVTWDVAARTVWMDDSYGEMEYRSGSREV